MNEKQVGKLCNDKNRVAVFIDNVLTCLELTGRDTDSLAAKTEINRVRLAALKAGTANRLKPDEVEAICEDLSLPDQKLFYDYGTSSKSSLREHLKERGIKLAEDKQDDVPSVVNGVNGIAALQEEESDAISAADVAPEDDEQEAEDLELIWVDNLLAKTSDGQVFDLTTKNLRSDVIGRVRACFGEKTQKAFLEEANLTDKATSWFSTVGNGKARMYRKDLEKLATACGVSPYTLLKGVGMKIVTAPTKGQKAVEVITLSIPGVSEKETRVFFKGRILAKNTVLVEGRGVGDILELLGDEENADWEKAFFEWTEAGAKLTEDVKKVTKFFKGKANPVRAIILRSFEKAINE